MELASCESAFGERRDIPLRSPLVLFLLEAQRGVTRILFGLFHSSSVHSPKLTSDCRRWRNAVGLGLYTLAKDLISLSYEYLSRREVQSRHLRDRPFAEVDPKELDLLPSPNAQ